MGCWLVGIWCAAAIDDDLDELDTCMGVGSSSSCSPPGSGAQHAAVPEKNCLTPAHSHAPSSPARQAPIGQPCDATMHAAHRLGFWPSAFVDLQQQHSWNSLALALHRIQFQKKIVLRLSASRFALLVSALLIASTWRLRQSTNKDLISCIFRVHQSSLYCLYFRSTSYLFLLIFRVS